MRADLASMWSPRNETGNLRRAVAKDSSPVPLNENESAFDHKGSLAVDADVTSMKVRMVVELFSSQLCAWAFSWESYSIGN